MGISKSKEVLLNSSMQNKILFILILIQIHCAVLTSQDKSISLAGIRDKVTITIDTWGVCHIMASNEEDMFYAQGWNAARDRLFQFEVWRLQASGTVSYTHLDVYKRQSLSQAIYYPQSLVY